MADMRQRPGDQRGVAGDLGRALGLGVAHQRPDLDPPVVARDTVEPADAVEVDEQARRAEPHVEGGDQALAAGQQAGLVMGQELDRVRDRASLRIGKWRRLHARPPVLFALFYCGRERPARHYLRRAWRNMWRLVKLAHASI